MTTTAPLAPAPDELDGDDLGNWNRRREPRVGVMYHYDASASDAGALAWLTRDRRCTLSYNWLVLDSGQLVRVAPEDARAWHAGVCRSSDPARLRYRDANSALYGIAFAATAGEVVTPAAITTAAALCRSLFQRNRWPLADTWRIVSHHTEAWPRGRKVDVVGPDPDRPVLDLAAFRVLVATGAP